MTRQDPAARPRARSLAPVWGVTLLLLAIVLAWRLADVLLLLFAAVLIALILRLMARPLERRWSLRAALTAVVITLGLAFVLGFWLVGASAIDELQTLR